LDAFLEHRFAEPLRSYRASAPRLRWIFNLLSVLGIAAGVISSGVAAGWSGAEWARIMFIVLGLVTATSATLIQIWRPGQQAAARERAADALMAEGWAFIQRRGRYKPKDGQDSAVGTFVDEVMRIGSQAAEDAAFVPGVDPTQKATGRASTRRSPRGTSKPSP
jgi:hypothetical protein